MERKDENAIYNMMFELLLKNRREDLIRATQAVAAGSKRMERGESLRKWYHKTVGVPAALTEEQMSAVKETWKDVWDTNLVKPFWSELYLEKTGDFNPEYIGSDLHYYNVEWNMIDYDYLRAFLDKNYMDILLPCVKHPVTLLRKIHGLYFDVNFQPLTKSQAVELLYRNRKTGVVVKISRESCGGKGVTFIGEKNTKDDISAALEIDRDMAVQLVMQQHPQMAKMNASSVNTIRIICVMLDGESIPLSAVVRIGNSGSRVDNFSSGGISCGIQPDGHLNEYGYTQKGERYAVHTNGFVFKDGFVPNFDKALEAVKRCHMRVPMFGMASWDIAIDTEGEPVLIEYNVSGASIDIHQYNNGPLYGKYRERIIRNVFQNYAERSATLDYNYSVAHGKAAITKGSMQVKNLVIPKELGGAPVRAIYDNSFKANSSLEELTIEADLERIGALAFYNCTSLKRVTFRGRVTSLSRSAFNSCAALEEIELPDGCEKIGLYAFRYCKKLKKIVIPASVTSIDEQAFLETPNVVIYCKEGSAAERYAVARAIPCKLI